MLWAALHFPRFRSQALARGHASPEAGPEALAAAATWLGQFTPRVTLEPPDALAAEVQGSLRLFGGLGRLKARLERGLEELGFRASIAFAGSVRAALWRAAGGGAALDALPVEVTRAGEESIALLHGLGVRTIGELARLPRDGVALRFGRGLLEDLDRALGRIPEPRAYFVPPARFAARLELPAPVSEAEGVLFAARRLLAQLEGFLAARQAGVRGFALVLEHERASPVRIEVNLAAPSREAAHFLALAREKLQRIPLAAPAGAIRVSAEALEPLPGASAALFRDARSAGEDWTRLVERLAARLGGGAVHGLAVHSEHRPERAWRRTEPGAPSPAIEIREPRPLWLLETPRRLAEGEFALLAGPERIESGWWDGEDARRDYYIARGRDGSLAWIYRAADGWYQHGIFA